MRPWWLALSLLAVFASGSVRVGPAGAEEPFEAISLLGDTLRAPALPDSIRADREARLTEAQELATRQPEDIDTLIWLGRRLAYLGRFREAIDVFTRAIELDEWDARLFRHRGHRFITLREFDRAVADLERAAELILGRQDEVEPDGLPNQYGIPTSTLHFNVWYHLGLAYYLQGDFENARRCYLQCLEVSRNPDSVYATAHWLYMTLRRLGNMDEAATLVEGIDATKKVLENEEYKLLIQMYQLSVRTGSDRVTKHDQMRSATILYGVGCWYLTQGNESQAREVFEQTLRVSDWPYFGHLAAEADLARRDD